MASAHSKGLVLACLAYAAWGFLSPVGSILLEDGEMGPWTLNALRTLAALPLFFILFGPRLSVASFELLRNREVWIVGALWLPLTFIPYLASLKFLPPTIATLTVYLSPLAVAAWQHYRFHERVSPWIVPTAFATLIGGVLSTQGAGGVALDANGWTGLGLAALGILGWTAYTIHSKKLTTTHDPNALVLAAFIASAVPFTLGAAVERFHVAWERDVILWLALYVVIPTFTSFWLYSLALRRAPAATVAVLIGVELAATAVVSYFVTGEVFGPLKVAGLVIVAIAITLYLWSEARPESQGNVPE